MSHVSQCLFRAVLIFWNDSSRWPGNCFFYIARRVPLIARRAPLVLLVSLSCSLRIPLVIAQEIPAREDAPSEERRTLASLTDVWKQREAGIQTAHVEYVNRQVIGRGSKKGWSGLPDASQTFPSEDVEAEVRMSLVIDEENFRFTVSGLQWDNRAEKMVDTMQVIAFDGQAYTLYNGVPDATDRVYKLAFVYGSKEKSIQEMGLVLPHYLPLFQAFRPAHDRFRGGRVGEWNVLYQRQLLGEIPCVVLESKAGPLVQQLWLDPDNDCSAVQWYVEMGGKAGLHSKIEYGLDGPERFIPQAWSTTRVDTNSGELAESHDVTLESCILNEPVDPKVFRMEFPAGTLVTAYGKTEYPKPENVNPDPPLKFIARENGEQRVITPAETLSGAKYSQLVTTESGHAAPAGSPLKGYSLLIVMAFNGALFAVVGLAIGIARWRRRV